MLGACGCSRSLISCSSSLMSCSSALPNGEAEDRSRDARHASGALIDAQGNAVAVPGSTERRRAGERPAPPAPFGAGVSPAFSVSRPRAVHVADRRGGTNEPVPTALVAVPLAYL